MPISKRTILAARKQRAKQRDENRAAKRIEQGLCRRCGGSKERTDIQHCTKCSERRKSIRLKSTYGIDLSEYNRLLVIHEGACWICGKKEKLNHGVLVVDHDHKTGKVRGLLCDTCNHGLAKFHDSTDLLRRAAEYVEQSKV